MNEFMVTFTNDMKQFAVSLQQLSFL